jgi:hypothetical protein
MVFSCKNYRSPQGLSLALHTRENLLLQVKGLQGKGLGITEQSTGTHIAFVGGTGVLVFMDLIALMLRQSLGLISVLSPKFKLILYASFENRASAFNLDLLQGLHDISKQLNLDCFTLVLRISQESPGERWT